MKSWFSSLQLWIRELWISQGENTVWRNWVPSLCYTLYLVCFQSLHSPVKKELFHFSPSRKEGRPRGISHWLLKFSPGYWKGHWEATRSEFHYRTLPTRGFPGGASGKDPACQRMRYRRSWLDPSVGQIPWRRKWQATECSCLEIPMDRGAWQAAVHGGRTEPDTTEQVSRHTAPWSCRGQGKCKLKEPEVL